MSIDLPSVLLGVGATLFGLSAITVMADRRTGSEHERTLRRRLRLQAPRRRRRRWLWPQLRWPT